MQEYINLPKVIHCRINLKPHLILTIHVDVLTQPDKQERRPIVPACPLHSVIGDQLVNDISAANLSNAHANRQRKIRMGAVLSRTLHVLGEKKSD